MNTKYLLVESLINEQTYLSTLPDDLVKFLLSGPVKKLDNTFKSNLEERNSLLQKDLQDWIKKTKARDSLVQLDLVPKLQLQGIMSYANGDIVFFANKDAHVYEWNHELGTFNILVKEKLSHNSVTGKHPYASWMKQIKSGKMSAWDK